MSHISVSDLTSSTSALHVSVYDRNRPDEGFLGMLDIKPVLKDNYTLDSWYKLGTRGEENVTGELWIQVTYHAIRVSRNSFSETMTMLIPNIRAKHT